jgi:F-type H+-transporting ATPase subunit delta
MKIRKRDRREAKQLFRICCPKGALNEDRVRQVVGMKISQSHRNRGPVLEHLLRLVRLNRVRNTAIVETAVPLVSEMREQTQRDLSRRYGTGLAFRFVEQPSLIGGMRVQVGHDVYDGSIQGELRELEQKL